jgi:adenylyltransferase/sulfurtransferase
MVRKAQAEMPSASAREVHEARENGEDIVVLDVREKDEWEAYHIPGAVNLTRGRLEGYAEERLPDKNARIVCH